MCKFLNNQDISKAFRGVMFSQYLHMSKNIFSRQTYKHYDRQFYQGAFHVVNAEDLRREIESLLGVAVYSLLPWRGGATIFCFTRRKCWRDGVIYNYYK